MEKMIKLLLFSACVFAVIKRSSEEGTAFQDLIKPVPWDELICRGVLVSDTPFYSYYRYGLGNVKTMFRCTKRKLDEAKRMVSSEAEAIKSLNTVDGFIKVKKYFDQDNIIMAAVKDFLCPFDEFLFLMDTLGLFNRLKMYLEITQAIEKFSSKSTIGIIRASDLAVRLLPQPKILLMNVEKIIPGRNTEREKSIYSYCSMTTDFYSSGCDKLDVYWNALIIIAVSEMGTEEHFKDAISKFDLNRALSPSAYVTIFLDVVDRHIARFDVKGFLKIRIDQFKGDMSNILIGMLRRDLKNEIEKYRGIIRG